MVYFTVKYVCTVKYICKIKYTCTVKYVCKVKKIMCICKVRYKKEFESMKKNDFILIGIVLILAGLIWLGFNYLHGDNGERVVITIDGKKYGSYELDKDKRIDITDNKLGYNQVVIENGRVYVSEADCPDKYCMRHKKISNSNEPIVCLPHKLVVEIVES